MFQSQVCHTALLLTLLWQGIHPLSIPDSKPDLEICQQSCLATCLLPQKKIRMEFDELLQS